MIKKLKLTNYGCYKNRTFKFGQFTIVSGPAGSGKTTLIRAVCDAVVGKTNIPPRQWPKNGDFKASWSPKKPNMMLHLNLDVLWKANGKKSAGESAISRLKRFLKTCGERPDRIVLLDDIFRPLDEIQRKKAMAVILRSYSHGGQFVLTDTNLLPQPLFGATGKVTPIKLPL